MLQPTAGFGNDLRFPRRIKHRQAVLLFIGRNFQHCLHAFFQQGNQLGIQLIYPAADSI